MKSSFGTTDLLLPFRQKTEREDAIQVDGGRKLVDRHAIVRTVGVGDVSGAEDDRLDPARREVSAVRPVGDADRPCVLRLRKRYRAKAS